MQGTIFVISAPSGAGKDSLCSRLFQEFPDLRYSVSYTTRPPRASEKEGRDYHFVGRDRFLAMAADGEFVEWAEVHGNCYGTAYRALTERRSSGVDQVLIIDVQGARALKDKGVAAVNIFIMPPSLDELRRRLVERGTDSPAVIEKRLENAASEMAQAVWFDHLVVNDNFNEAVDRLKAIVAKERQQ